MRDLGIIFLNGARRNVNGFGRATFFFMHVVYTILSHMRYVIITSLLDLVVKLRDRLNYIVVKKGIFTGTCCITILFLNQVT